MLEKNPISPLISIIVPVYKVEVYLLKCLESISAQTYRNLEIIVINDGSPDNSGKIADQFALVDPRVMVIHTENRGVSTARNLGIDKSKGEYICFVDSDDYLSPDFVDYMLSIVKKTGTNFVMSRNCYKSPNELQIEIDEIKTYSPEKAASALLYPYIDIGCWNKLFNRNFLITNGIKFPVKFFMGEGLNFIVNAAQLSNNVGIGNKKVYYYRKDNQDSATTKAGVDKFINALAAIENIKNSAILKTPDFATALEFHQYLTTFYAWDSILRTDTRKKYPSEYDQWLSVIKNDAFGMMKAHVSISMKLKILVHSVNPYYILSIRHFLGQIKRKVLA